MKKLLLFSGFLIGWALLSLPAACTYYNEEDLYGPQTTCDTTALRYSVEIKEILQANCYSCHTVASNISGYPFEDYETLHDYATSGKLVERINDPINPMPQSGVMSLCNREKIAAWVNAGAPNN